MKRKLKTLTRLKRLTKSEFKTLKAPLCVIQFLINYLLIVILSVVLLLSALESGKHFSLAHTSLSSQAQHHSHQHQHQHQSQNQQQLADFSISSETRQSIWLPCVVGKRSICGAPYIVVWYKFQQQSRVWQRLDLSQQQNTYVATSQRLSFDWPLSPSRSCPPTLSLSSSSSSSSLSLKRATATFQAAECAALTLRDVQANDEGQYKCEVTYAETLDFDKCPPSTVTLLNVNAAPSSPAAFVNGKLVVDNSDTVTAAHQDHQRPQLKEGDQVRLECQTAGGRPPPRIEWLNVSWPADSSRPPLVAPLKQLWPVKNIASAGVELVTSSLAALALTRFDVRSEFVCVVAANRSAPQDLAPAAMRALLSPSGLQNQAQDSHQHQLPMVKRVKLNVLVKPSRVSVAVLDVSNARDVRLATSASANSPLVARLELLDQSEQIQSRQESLRLEPHYSLNLNKVYAIQCLVDDSKPPAQVAWYNRTNLIQLPALRARNNQEFEIPSLEETHRLSSFVKVDQSEKGADLQRTIATLILTPNVFDNFEELFCRVSTSAFEFDELTQVAPIIAAKLHVNYPPIAWLEAASSSISASDAIGFNLDQATANSKSDGLRFGGDHSASSKSESALPEPTLTADGLGRQLVQLPEGANVTISCHLAASPLQSDAFVQFDWTRNGRLLNESIAGGIGFGFGAAGDDEAAEIGGGQLASLIEQRTSRYKLEQTTHLHIVDFESSSSSSIKEQQQSAAASTSKLLATSRLLITNVNKRFDDNSSFGCMYKIAQAPRDAILRNLATQRAQKIISGQAATRVQLHVHQAPPADVQVSLAGVSSTTSTTISNGLEPSQDQKPRIVELNEAQLAKLALFATSADSALVECTVRQNSNGRLKWTVTGITGAQHLLPSAADGQALSLRRLLALRSPSSSNSLNDAMLNLLGTYTCTATNSRGSASASIKLQMQGRPLCAMGGDYARPTCLIYANPPLLQTVWLMPNGSRLGAEPSNGLASNSSLGVWLERPPPQNAADYPQQQLKCVARNALGYSDECSTAAANIYAGAGNESGTQSPGGGLQAASRFASVAQSSSPSSLTTVNFKHQATGPNATLIQQQPPQFSPAPNAKFELHGGDFALGAVGAVALSWLIFSLLGAVAHRMRLIERRPASSSSSSGSGSGSGALAGLGASFGAQFKSGVSKKTRDKRHVKRHSEAAGVGQDCWRLAVGGGHPTTTPISGYYATTATSGSQADSERDMIASCSQSSHYEDFGVSAAGGCGPASRLQAGIANSSKQTPLASQLYQSQALATLARVATGGRKMEHQQQQQQQHSHHQLHRHLTLLNEQRLGSSRSFAATSSSSFGSARAAPLIGNGVQSSRINLNQNNSHCHPRNEHIYDDVI